MVTLIGIILVVVGVSDFAAAAVLQTHQRREGNPGGLGDASATPVVRMLKLIGVGTIVAGVVLIVVGLAG